MASTPLPSTPSTSTTANWICRACKDSEDVEVDLQQMGGEMVCPLCATVDAHASSVVGHVDVSEITGQIVDDASTHQSMDRSRMFSGDWNEKRYIKHVDGLIRLNLQHIFGHTNFNLENGSRLWLDRIRQIDQEERGLKRMTFQIDSKRLPYHVLLAVRMAVAESNLIAIYNRLPGRKIQSAGAIQNYTKGDERVFTMTILEVFDKSHEVFDLGSEARLGYIEALQKHDKNLSAKLGNSLTPHDIFLCALSKAIVIIQSFTQLDVEGRKAKLRSSITKPNWPEEPFDRLRKIKDWDDVFRIAEGLYQAQACVSLFPPAINIYSGVIAIATIAVQIAVGDAPKNMPSLEVELSKHLVVNRDNITARVPEMNKLIMAWSSSIPEAGLPLPALKPPKRSSMIGKGVVGWGSDKRRPVPVSAIVPKAGRVIAENWRAIKRVRLKRPAVIPYEEEIALSRQMFTGSVVTSERHALLRKYTIPDDTSTPSRSVSPQVSQISDSSSDRQRQHENGSRERGQSRIDGTPPRRPHQSLAPAPQHKLDEVRQWIEQGDDSSDDDQSASTDDDTPRPKEKRPRLFETRQEIGELPRPFAFSIGPTGFGIDRTDSSSAVVASSSPAGGPIKSAQFETRGNDRGQSVESVPSDGLTSASDSCQMVRQSSSASSRTSTSGPSRAISTPRSSSRNLTPTRYAESPEPSSRSEVSAYSRASEMRAVQRGLTNDEDHLGVLKRERPQYVRSKLPVKRPVPVIKTMPEPMVIKAITLWLDQQEASGSIPKIITPEYLAKFGLKNGRLPTDLDTYLASQAVYRSPLETLLRIGIRPMDIPSHLLPYSVSAAHLNLYHYHQRDDILGHNPDKETPQLAETSLRLFFRGFGNDTLAETFIKEESMELTARIDHLYTKGDWDDLEDPSPVKKAAFRKRKRPDYQHLEPANMIQRIARELGDGEPGHLTPEAETEMIQKAVMASLMYVQQRPPVDQYKTTATVPLLWYNDGLTELHLVPQTKISITASKDYTDRIWAEWEEQETRENIHMPHPSGAGEVLLESRGLIVDDEGMITRS